MSAAHAPAPEKTPIVLHVVGHISATKEKLLAKPAEDIDEGNE